MDNQLTPEDIVLNLELLDAVAVKGSAALRVALLQQKLKAMLPKREETVNKPEEPPADGLE